ncbi:carboxymuconolactone decarboxylase family protein [Ancylobacter defluvii]|uniref:4-carboxymuconolactone decarboxylase n=1 Tax=Ancylobacter defluvii TaxID=1282440 RepID=A0A9W6JYB0_9HYPH|nr:carboxymuconolactone decarboxylase family protein [Ancylobacter defluvii]MBS7589174.1 carboxymuconolactone decarboxylase family protein [Ancylobacter defluvii]GLK84786.1 4-carboxymuconolactone decarboxylase [Ancylobacter defluvii]
MDSLAAAPPRYRELDPAGLDADQRRIFEEIGRPRAGAVPAPFHIYVESPELAATAQAVGAFCRYRTGLPPRLSELAILTTASYWGAAYEFTVHAREARKAGVPEFEIEALAAGHRPDFTEADAALVHDFASAVYQHQDVPDALFAAAVERFGRRTVIELTGLLGYYSMLAIALRVFRVPPPA